ncbi:PREDICTED: chromo domain-containing protein cec-1-like [Camelina sativa]|uniref:Chromo domain-containing protein cec-1-like n=1 Tax=Camelina sativa TaxID=90675 RepID=A0ABM0V9V0_CAMSA|nr:PREDICTED: chromo domain-containing protein cec-1-like [Camelina sativa]
MATTSSTTKTKPDNKNLTRSRSLGRKPKPVSSSEPEANANGSDRKTIEKPLPNYLKPTISSRPDPVKFLRKNNNAVEDNQKLLRRRSFDRPPSSLTSPSTSAPHKSLNTSTAAHPRDRPAVPREKPVTGLRSTSFHGSSRGGLRGSSTVKSPPVASRGSSGVKKSGLSGSSSSQSKKEGSENVPKKSLSKEVTPESSPRAPANEDEQEIVKVETNVDTCDRKDETKEEDKDQLAQPDESGEEKETSPVAASTEEEKGELINEDKTEEQTEEPKEPESTQEEKGEDEDGIKEKVDDEEKNIETVATSTDIEEASNIEENKEEGQEEAEVKEEESESSKSKEETTETEAQVEEVPEEGTKKEVVQGKKESPTAYNDVIASKMQENSKKNKVLALAGAFQTVIDYETAASK